MLVIEDDDDIRESLSEMLGACGYSALAVPSAHQALVLLRKGFRPRVIVLDPFTANDVEGFHVSLGSNPAWATIPVIAGPNTRAAERMAYSGPQHILGKALDPRELLTFLGRYCIATSVRF